ncbi:trimeric autotransporter adhesin [Advenella incenata]|uniref:Trimeric autotransporter adhesin n=1 Tax=Advenella incenata TaxID=267800 RepID=A0A4Q7VS92_9BURK|nr:YadA-like family protein [Advenella incenata]RZT99204.1 trimeric autotransporter adhesin [Advenella incenata]
MNRIYRSIWCEKTGTFVAVSENTKRGRKTGAGTDKTELGSLPFHDFAVKALLPVLFTGAIALFPPMALAAGDLTTSECTFSWGNDTGGTITIKGEGTGSSDTLVCAEALQGLVDNPLEYFSVNSTGGGNVDNDGAVAPDGIAIGKNASVGVGATSGVALGLGATTTVANGIALGAGSIANTAAGIAPYAPAGASVPSVAAVNATTSSLGALSVGDPATGKLRQITGVAGGTQNTDAVNVSQLKAVESLATGAGAGWNLTANNGATTQNIAPGGSADFIGGTNTNVVQTGNQIKVNLNDSVNLAGTLSVTGLSTFNGGAVIGNSLTVNPATTVNMGGNRINNVAAGVADTDAVNVSQLIDQGDDLTAKGLNFVGNDALPVHKDLGQTLSIVGGAVPVAGTFTSQNIQTFNDAGAIRIQMADSPKFGNVVINNAGSGKITGVTDGDVTALSTDAVNGSQLFDVQTTANKGWDLTANNGATTQNIAPGGSADFIGGTNTNVVQTGNQIKVNLNDSVNLAGTLSVTGLSTFNGGAVIGNSLTVNPATTVNMGGNRINNVAAGIANTDAVNVSQLTDQGDDLTAKGLNFVGNDALSIHKDLGQTLSIVGGAVPVAGTYSSQNVQTFNDAGAIRIQMADSPKFGGVVINDAGSGKITGVMDGAVTEFSTDAVNGSQLFAVQSTAGAGWKLTANNGATTQTIAPGGSADFIGGTNTNVVQTGNQIKVNLNDSVNLAGTLAVTGLSTFSGGAVIGNSLTVNPGATVNMGGNRINNVAAGVANTDAVNVSQLKDQGDELTAKGLDFAGNVGIVHRDLGSTMVIQGGLDPLATASNKNIRTEVDAGTGAMNVMLSESPVFGAVTVNDAGGGKITGVTDGDVTELSTDAVNGSQLFGVQTTANKGWDLTANNGATTQNIAPGGSADFIGGTNTNVVQTGNQIKVNLNDNVDLAGTLSVMGLSTFNGGAVIGNSLTVNPGTTVNMGGNKITNVAAGVADTDAVNVSQLTDQGDDLTAKGLNFVGNGGLPVHKDLGQTLSIVGGAVPVAGTYSSQNVQTFNDAGAIRIQMADSPKFGGVVINDAGGGKITGVTDGDVTELSTDAVNGSQLFGVQTTANKGWDLTANNGATTQNIAPGGSADFIGGTNTNVVQTGNQIKVNLNDNVDLAGTLSVMGLSTFNGGAVIGNSLMVNPGTTVDMGGNRINNVAAGVVGTDAVNVSQLTDQGDDLTAKGLNFVGNDALPVHKDLGQTLSIVGGAVPVAGTYSSQNVQTFNDAGAIRIQMADSPKFGGVVINDGGSGKITGVMDGAVTEFSTEAVNGSQLFGVQTTANKGWNLTANNGATTQNIAPGGSADFIGGTNTNVVQTGNQIKVNLNDNVDLAGTLSVMGLSTFNGGAVIGNSLTVNPGTIVNMGGNRINNVAAGVDPMDAVNVSQLKDQDDELTAKGLNFAGNVGAVHRDLGSTMVIQGGLDPLATASNKNIRTEVDPDTGAMNIMLSESPVFGAVTVNAGGTGKITGVSDGLVASGSKDAVNGGQLFGVQQEIGQLSNLPITFTGNSGSVDRKLGQQLKITGEATTAGTYSGANIRTVVEGNEVKVQMAQAPVFQELTVAGNTTIGGSLNMSGNKITNVGAGDISATSQDAVNGSQLYNIIGEVKTVGWNLQTNGDTPSKVLNNDTVQLNDGSNVNITRDGRNVTIAVDDNPTFNSVNIGGGAFVANSQSVEIRPETNVSMGGNQIHQVANGTAPMDAVNVRQLSSVESNLNSRINRAEKRAEAGTAAAMAVAGLPQAYLPGKSMFAVAGSVFQGESGVAMGLSTVSGNGKWVLKGSVTSSSRGQVGGTVGVGYQW